MTQNQQQLDKLIAQLAEKIANCDDAALLETLIESHSSLRARRGELANTPANDITPQDDQGAPSPQDDYQHWRELKRRADAMLRVNPGILRAVSGGRACPDRILAGWRKLGGEIADFEEIHADDLEDWRALARAEMPPRATEETETPVRKIRLFGRMMTRAQKLRHELSFRLWAGIRYIADGENNAPVETIRAQFSDGGRYAFTSWPNLRKQINKAIDRGYLHYSKDRSRLYFASERRVALSVLGLDAVGGWAIGITIEELTADYLNNRALFHSAFHASRGDGLNNPISRQSIEQETGRGKRTQRKYETLAKVKTASNYELIEDETSEDPALRRILADGDYQLVKDLPNSYAANQPTVKRGRRWLNHRITYLCKQFSDNGHNPPVIVMGSCNGEIKKRRYFTKPPSGDADSVRFYPLPGDTRLWARVC